MTALFSRTLTVPLRSTDAAGVLFFAEQLALVHDVYEAWLADAGLSIRALLDAGTHALPIVKASTELLAPIRVGDVVRVELSCARVGSTSFTLAHALRSTSGDVVGRGETVHVYVERAARRPAPLPERLRAALGVDTHSGGALS